MSEQLKKKKLFDKQKTCSKSAKECLKNIKIKHCFSVILLKFNRALFAAKFLLN